MPNEPKRPSSQDPSADESDNRAGARQYHLHASGGFSSMVGYPVGFVMEGDPADPAGRRLESRPASGGEVTSRVDADGSYEVQRTGSLDLGRSDETRAIRVLLQALREAGHSAELVEGAEDGRGEDGRIRLDGFNYVLQIVSVPADDRVWSELARTGQHFEVGILGDVVEAVRVAFERKRRAAAGTILVLNAAHLGAVIGPKLVQNYFQRFGNPCDEYGVHEAWIVGPSARSTFRFIGPTDAG
jgi:hypothetical protein